MKNTYYIYQCIAIRNDGTHIERIFKMPSFWNCETIAFALITIGDAPGYINNINIENKEIRILIDDNKNLSLNISPSFYELNDSNIKVVLNYKDGTKTFFECNKIGEEISSKTINRKTPIVVHACGYSRFTKKEFFANKRSSYLSPEAYENVERFHTDRASKDMKCDYTYFASCFTATMEDLIRMSLN